MGAAGPRGAHGVLPRPAGPSGGRLRAAIALDTGMLITGCREGEMQMWSASTLLQRTQAHAGALRALTVAPDGRRFASGGDDGAVLLWESNGVRLYRIDLATRLGSLLDSLGRAQSAAGNALPSVAALAWFDLSASDDPSKSDEALAVGTRQAELHVLSLRRPQQPPEPLQRARGRPPSARPCRASERSAIRDRRRRRLRAFMGHWRPRTACEAARYAAAASAVLLRRL